MSLSYSAYRNLPIAGGRDYGAAHAVSGRRTANSAYCVRGSLTNDRLLRARLRRLRKKNIATPGGVAMQEVQAYGGLVNYSYLSDSTAMTRLSPSLVTLPVTSPFFASLQVSAWYFLLDALSK